MTQERIYMDYNATAPLRDDARAAMSEALSIYGNPSSVHHEGRRARAAVERARAQVASLAGCEPGEVVFTSGATESNQTVIGSGWSLVAVSAVEHESVLAAGHNAAGAGIRKFVEMPCGRDGRVEPEYFKAVHDRLESGDAEIMSNPLVSVQLANGETGVIQRVENIGAIAREQGYLFHTDAVQAAGKVALDFAGLGADFMSLSAHKIGGPKGVGALIIRDGAKLKPLIHGGSQESGRRAGTENVPGIIGLGAAAEAALSDLPRMNSLRRMRDRLENEALAMSEDASTITQTPERLPNIASLALKGAKSETLVIAFDLAGIAVSAGSACSSGKASRSHVQEAMGVPVEIAEGTFRVSLGWGSTESDVDRFLEAWAGIVKQHEKQAVA